MNRKSVLKKATLGLVGLALLGTVAGCGSTSKKDSTENNSDATLTGYIAMSSTAGATQKAKWFTKILKQKTGVTLNFKDNAGTSSSQIMQSLLSSGELPDIVGFMSKTDAKNATDSGQLLNLDKYKDQLPNIYKNKNFENAIKYQRDTAGGKDHGLYTMTTSVGPQDDINFNPQLRWDLYKKVGKPEIKTLDDYLPVLKAMQKSYPKTSDGKPTYGISLVNNFDSTDMALATYVATVYGVDSREIHSFVEIPSDGKGEIKPMLSDDSEYKKVLDFFYKANQEGLVDPDSITQKWDDLVDKYNNGRVLFSPWKWAVGGFNTTANTNKTDFKGYESVWANDFSVPVLQDNPTGETRTLGISANVKNKKAALKFLNYFYSDECTALLFNGPKGQVWDTKDGKNYVTDKGYDIVDNSKELAGGGTIVDAYNIINSSPMTPQTVDPKNKQSLSYVYWDSTLNRDQSKNKLVSDWRKDYGGAIDMFHYAKSQKKYLVKTTAAFSLMTPLSDDLVTKRTQIGDIVKSSSWKMVFAKNDKEYNQLWSEMKTKAKGLGVDKIVDARTQAFAKAQKLLTKYDN